MRVFNGFGAFLLVPIQQENVLRSAVFAKYPGLPISKSYDQNKFSCFPLMKTVCILRQNRVISSLKTIIITRKREHIR